MTSGITTDNLLAVALVINRSRDGPAFVFHYPPQAQSATKCPEPADAIDSEDLLLERLSLHLDREVGASKAASKLGHHDTHVVLESGSHIVPWEHVAGFPTRDLAGILTPARPYHKQLFQLSLDPLLCISHPIHVAEDGRWKRKKTADSARPATSKSALEQSTPAESVDDAPSGETGQVATENRNQERAKEDEGGGGGGGDDEKRSSMTMFNVIFMLNANKSEPKDLVDPLYTHIVKKVTKTFRYSQQHSDFVWKESKRILAAKETAREERKPMSVLWRELLQTSSLAASIHDIYEAVSQNKIATLHLETTAGLLTPSVQIPVPFCVSDVWPERGLAQRGLWLTTANALLDHEVIEDPSFLDRNFALLLMEDEKKIVAELQADRDPTTLSMMEFVRLAKPTTTFHQLGQSKTLTISQVRKYAQHFIFWRRAIAIPPLHDRDTYVLSPNAHLKRLPEASQRWQRAFPVAPPLPNFLAEISNCPRPYKALCPSRAHRPLYLEMLAWLLRGGWVTQLCTFGYVVIWPEIIYEVDYELEAEDIAAMSTPAAEEDGSLTEQRAASMSSSLDESVPHHPVVAEDALGEEGSSISTASTTTTPKANVHPTAEHAAEMARLERIALKASREAADKITAHARKMPPTATAHPSINDAPHLAGLAPLVIPDAKKATGKESRYLLAVARRLQDDEGRAAWQLLGKYLDGRSALERIALQEDMKRKDVWNLLMAVGEHLLCVRHW